MLYDLFSSRRNNITDVSKKHLGNRQILNNHSWQRYTLMSSVDITATPRNQSSTKSVFQLQGQLSIHTRARTQDDTPLASLQMPPIPKQKQTKAHITSEHARFTNTTHHTHNTNLTRALHVRKRWWSKVRLEIEKKKAGTWCTHSPSLYFWIKNEGTKPREPLLDSSGYRDPENRKGQKVEFGPTSYSVSSLCSPSATIFDQFQFSNMKKKLCSICDSSKNRYKKLRQTRGECVPQTNSFLQNITPTHMKNCNPHNILILPRPREYSRPFPEKFASPPSQETPSPRTN